MDLTGRPAIADFRSLLGTVFHVQVPDAQVLGEFTLRECQELPKPPMDSLEGHDCFSLTFEATPPGVSIPAQGIFDFTTADQSTYRLFAVPSSPAHLGCV